MPRPRTLDPLGTSDHPVVITDPFSEQAVVAEFQRRLRFIETSFRTGRMISSGHANFNQSLRRLKRAVRQSRPNVPLHRLHPELELLIAYKARRHAVDRVSEDTPCVIGEDIRRASQEVVLEMKPRRGAPNDQMLRHHVWAMIALFQETSGKPVLATRYTEYVYSPKPANALAERIISLFQSYDPSIQAERISLLILEARRANAGRAMRFSDFFPLYGATLDFVIGVPAQGIGWSLERMEWAMPIYCP